MKNPFENALNQREFAFILSKKKLRELWYIIFRSVFVLSNAIILAVVVLLFAFKSARSGLFIGIILILNIFLGLFQEIRVWFALQKLQLLTTSRFNRLAENGSEELVFAEDLLPGNHIALKTGDQVPCDGTLASAHGLEINEGLITGESNSLPRSVGDRILAGSIVTSGSGVIRIETAFKESRIARMTDGISKYSISQSPIQRSTNLVITYSIYVLLAGIAFVLLRSFFVHEAPLRTILTIGAITSAFVPQGLVFGITLFFVYGAARLFKKQVLLQEVNAIERLGRIKNLCMDKTGTLTHKELDVEEMCVYPNISKDQAEALTAAYLDNSGDTTELARAMKRSIRREYKTEAAETLAFSSWRQYGAVRIKNTKENNIVFVGLPDKLLTHFVNETEQSWLQNLIDRHAHLGKRLVAVSNTTGSVLPKDLSETQLSLVAVFIFHNDLREGVRDTVDFFQNRGVQIRIISGDNPETTRAIASSAGINNSDSLICGKDIETWDGSDFENKVGLYSIFATVMPEHKEKIIAAFKKDGFTAMIGDGANDALAVKTADLGIAMFDGAAATRQLSSIVLMNNSFAAIPGGVELADIIIKNTEVFASLFFNQILLGFFFFIMVSILGFEYPFTPLNITFINYFTIGVPWLLLSGWTLKSSAKIRPANHKSFLKRIMPFAAWSAFLQACGAIIIFGISPNVESNTLVLLAFIAFGFAFFICAPGAYHETLSKQQKIQLFGGSIIALLILFWSFHVPFIVSFFAITPIHISALNACEVLFIIFVFCYLQYKLSKYLIVTTNIKFNYEKSV